MNSSLVKFRISSDYSGSVLLVIFAQCLVFLIYILKIVTSSEYVSYFLSMELSLVRARCFQILVDYFPAIAHVSYIAPSKFFFKALLCTIFLNQDAQSRNASI